MSRKSKLTYIGGSLPLTIIREDDQFIAYTPALDISTCGSTFDQAKERFGELIEIFFEELCSMGTLEDVLEECGWKKINKPEQRWIPPAVISQTTEEIRIPCHG